MRAALLIVALGACTGDIAMDEAGGGGDGQSMFASTVAPMLRGQCASCHEGSSSGPPFMGAVGGDDDYTALLANTRIIGGFETGSALLLTKGSHAGVGWWTAAQRTTIEDWMKVEASSTGPGDGGDILAAWASCMTLENWDDAMMGEWANKQTEGGATCGGCHADGEHGFHANPTSDVMFAQQRTQVGIGSFFQVQAGGTTPTVVPAVAKIRNKCSGANLHPECAVDDQYVEYLERYHALTTAMMNAGLCGEPGYKTLTDPL